MKAKCFVVSCIFLVMSVLVAGDSIAQEKSDKDIGWKPDQINIINPMSPGGGTDRRTRVIAAEMSKNLGIPVIVENRTGAGGAVGSAYFIKNMPADGTSLLAHYQVPFSGGQLLGAPYKVEDFYIVAGYAEIVPGIHVLKNSPFKTLADFIKYARANPGQVSIGYQVSGTDHIQVTALIKLFGLKLREVLYNGGGPVRTAIVGGHVDAIHAGSETTWEAVGDEIRTLCVHARKRNPLKPDVPTTKEVMEKDFPEMEVPEVFTDFSNWHFYATHKKAAEKYPERVKFVSNALKEVITSEKFKEYAKSNFWNADFQGPEEGNKKLLFMHKTAVEYKHVFED